MLIRDLDVIVVCEINVDIVVSGLGGPPEFGAERAVDDVLLTAGSSGVLVATNLADMGMRVGICGLVGDDEFGRFMLLHCRKHGIDSEGVVVDPSQRTGASVLLSTCSDRAILTHPGAMEHFTFDLLRLDILARARHLHVSSLFLQSALRPAVPRLFAAAHALGLSTSLDTGHDPAETWGIDGVLDGVDVFLPNEVEALAISGQTESRAALESLARRVPAVSVKCGARGAWAARSTERVFEPAYQVRTVDTTGAGDAFDAGFLNGWLAGDGLGSCVRRGNACGALTAAHLGGSGALSAAAIGALLATEPILGGVE